MRQDGESGHYTIVTLDIEGFGSPTRTDPIRSKLRGDLSDLLDTAIGRLHRDDPVAMRGDTGDGWFLLFAPHVPKPAIVDTFVPAVEAGLRLHNRAANMAGRLRLRIGVHHGDVLVEEGRPVGDALNFAFRIIDNDTAREVLRGNQRSHVVLVTSDDFFDEIVRQEHGGLEPDDFYPVRVEAKEVDSTVWVKKPEVTEVVVTGEGAGPAGVAEVTGMAGVTGVTGVTGLTGVVAGVEGGGVAEAAGVTAVAGVAAGVVAAVRPPTAVAAGPATAPVVAAAVGPPGARRAPPLREPRVLTLADLSPSCLYVPLLDVHNARLYGRRHPELPLAQHLETALLLGERAVLHCLDPYRSAEVARLVGELDPLVASGDLLFLLGENASHPAEHFRGYVDLKVKQFRLSDRGRRDLESLTMVDPDAADRSEHLLARSPYALIRGFNGSDAFVGAARDDLQRCEPIVLCEPYHASVVSRLSLSLRQLLDLSEMTSDGKLSRVLADEVTTKALHVEIDRLSGHRSFSRQILMDAIAEYCDIDESHPMYSIVEERVSLVHLRGATGPLHHLEVTSHRDAASPYFFKALYEHLSVLADVPNPDRLGADLLMRLRAQSAWGFFAAHHLRLMGGVLHRRSDDDAVADARSAFHWTRRVPEFATIRQILREHWA